MIYISRGGTIDDDALVAALQARKFAGAGLDVFLLEPTSFDNPFLPCYAENLKRRLGGGAAGARDQPCYITHLLACLGGGTRSAGWGRTRKY